MFKSNNQNIFTYFQQHDSYQIKQLNTSKSPMTTVSEKQTDHLYNLRVFPNKIILNYMISYHPTSSSSHGGIFTLKPLLISETNVLLLKGCLLNVGLYSVKVGRNCRESARIWLDNLTRLGKLFLMTRLE